MSIHKIMPGEMNEAHFWTIDTRCPRDHITDGMVLGMVDRQRLGLGDVVAVNIFDHEKTKVLYFAEFKVIGRAPEMRRVESADGDSRTFEYVGYAIHQTVEWTATAFGRALEADTKAAAKKAA